MRFIRPTLILKLLSIYIFSEWWNALILLWCDRTDLSLSELSYILEDSCWSRLFQNRWLRLNLILLTHSNVWSTRKFGPTKWTWKRWLSLLSCSWYRLHLLATRCSWIPLLEITTIITWSDSILMNTISLYRLRVVRVTYGMRSYLISRKIWSWAGSCVSSQRNLLVCCCIWTLMTSHYTLNKMSFSSLLALYIFVIFNLSRIDLWW